MPFRFTCPHCGEQTLVDQRFAGQAGPCVRCGRMVTVPGSPMYGPTPDAPGWGGPLVAILVLVVVGVVGLFFCAGFVSLFWMRSSVTSARTIRVQPPQVVPEDEDLFAGPAGGAAELPKSYYESPAPDRFTRVHLVPSDGDLPGLLKAEAAKAKAAGRKPFVEFGATWCPPCRKLNESLRDPRVVDAFSGTYIIHLDVEQWGSSPAATSFEVSGIPAFFEIDDRGEPTGRRIDGGDWGKDTPGNIARALKPFFQGHGG